MPWKINTNESFDETNSFLKEFAPWRANIEFSNGATTTEHETIEPWQQDPLRKVRVIVEAIGEEVFQNARILDIGFNCGYTSIYLAEKYGAQVYAIDVVKRHREVASRLAKMVGVHPTFEIASADNFEPPHRFNVIMHLGTLYHLANPVRSLQICIDALETGGCFALATEYLKTTTGVDETLCRFRVKPYPSWVMSKWAIENALSTLGLRDIREIGTTERSGDQGRIIYVAKK